MNDFADKLAMLIRDKKLRTRMGHVGHVMIDGLLLERVIASFRSIYSSGSAATRHGSTHK